MNDEHPESEEALELKTAVRQILESQSTKKVVIAGPGAGKTTLFKELLNNSAGDPDRRIVLTFINNLKKDLEKDLGELAKVFTLHSFCISLLHRKPGLRSGLSNNFKVAPGLTSIIKEDWEILRESDSPHFVDEMRNLAEENEIQFYLDRGNYYDAVDFDDSVYRVYEGFVVRGETPESYEMILIDEFQDFNNVEAGIIKILGRNNSIIIAGDDDQALYGQLRSSTWDNIRQLCLDGEFEVFMLPFCLRCPEVVVGAVNDIIARAAELNKLDGRIIKPYKYFPPVKGADSAAYPHIINVETSVQRAGVNYMGRYMAQAIEAISDAEVTAAAEGGYPSALVIVAKPYRDQIIEYLNEVGIEISTRRDSLADLDREYGLKLLKENPESNLGWRILLRTETSSFLREIITQTAETDRSIFSLLPEAFREGSLVDAAALKEKQESEPDEAESPPGVLVTSFEGAKGLSAQHVLICGLHDGEIPRDANNVGDIEICKFIVGITRTRKQCSLVHTRNFAGTWKTASSFIGWINHNRLEAIRVDKNYWIQQAQV
jgi:superfamily I DNA/RNA helicase